MNTNFRQDIGRKIYLSIAKSNNRVSIDINKIAATVRTSSKVKAGQAS
jgi:hypothetical protein